jgi:beta-lactamase regulating signal transducer with metallopeptidase domain
MSWLEILDPVFTERLCLTLLHSLWQVAALTIAASMIDRLARNTSAARSYGLYTSSLIFALAALPVTWCVVDVTKLPNVNAVSVAAETPSEAFHTALHANSEVASDVGVAGTPTAHAQPPGVIPLATNDPIPQDSSSSSDVDIPAFATPWRRIAPWAVTLYLAGVALMLTRLSLAIIRSNRLCRRTRLIDDGPLAEILQTLSQQWSLKVVPTLVETRNAIVPQVIGLLRPTILLPAAAVTGLSTQELELVLVHELAHIRRHDMWVQLLQRLAETFLFFNPMLWHLSRRISTLREYCCDDITCRATADPEPELRYASALLRIVELGSPRPVDLTALAASGRSPSELRRRVARLFGEPLSEPLRVSRTGLAASATVVALLAFSPTLWISGTEPVAEEQMPAADETEQTAQDALGTQGTKATEKLFQLLVAGPNGVPIPEASVEFRATPPVTAVQIRVGSFEKQGPYGSFCRTDAEGRLTVSLPPTQARLNVSITKPGFGPYWTGWDSGDHPEEIPERFTAELDAGWSVGGIVVDGDGNPVQRTEVHPYINFKKRPDDMRQLGVGTVFKTDERGAWRFDSVPDSQPAVTVSINHPEFQTIRRPLARADFELRIDESPRRTIELNAGLTVTGTVTDATGEPIEGALVKTQFINEIRQGISDEQGHYRLTGCDSRMARIVVSARGYATDMQEVQVDTDTKAVNFQMQPGGHVRVRVLDENGKGIHRARLLFQRWRGQFKYFEFGHIGQYTDENGVWEWNEAPLDEFKADISRPEGMQLQHQSLIAREQEYIFQPPTMLVVSGSVVDAKTKKPVPKFRVVPGTRNEPGRGTNDWWSTDEGYVAANGEYSIARRFAAPTHMIRIEADGYKVTTSRDIRSDEGKVAIDFELQRAEDIAIQLVTAAGKPAGGARIALGVTGSQIRIDRGEISDSQTYALQMVADSDGWFRMPSRDDPFQLVITHADGFAHLKSSDGNIPQSVTLTEWARVEGTFHIGKDAGPDVTLSLFSSGVSSYGENAPHIFTQHEVVTDKDGRFVLERVFPGTGFIGRNIVVMVDNGATEVTSSKRVPAQFVSGKTTTVNVGGDGRAVIGKLVPPEDYAGKVLWNFASIWVKVDLPQPPLPEPPEDVQNDEDRREKWWIEWQQTAAGKAMMEHQEDQRKQPSFHASIDRDGTFRIDDVSAGTYAVRMRFDRDAPGRLSEYRFSVPPVNEDDVGQTLDLGVLRLESVPEE